MCVGYGMNEWKSTTLGSIVSLGGGRIQTGPFGSQLHASDYVENGVPCIMPANMKDNRVDLTKISYISKHDANRLSRHLVKVGDVVYSRRGDVTQKVLIRALEDGYFCGTGCLLIRPGNRINSEFLTYHLSTPSNKSWIVKQAIGATMPSLNTKILSEVPLRVPDKGTQQKIAAVLSALDSKIELNNRINAELEAMAKTLYDYWFVQFDFPFDFKKGKPDSKGKPYKSSGGKIVYNKTLKREIPEGWEAGELGDVLKTTLGGTPSTKEPSYWKGADLIPWLSSSETASFPVISSNDFITQQGLENSATKLLPKGSVVISIVRYIRPSILAIDAAMNQSVAGIYESADLKHSFIYPFIVSDIPRLMSLRTGAQQPHINKKEIDSIPMIIPSKEVLRQYYGLANPIYEQITTKAFETQQLAQLRDWLLPMLMNGQVDVVTF